MNFKEWLLFVENNVRSYKKANPKNPSQNFVVLYGNTYPIKDELKNLGFRYFSGTWSIPESKLDEPLREKLANLKVDLSGLESTSTAAPTAHPAPKEIDTSSKIDNQLQQMKSTVDELISSEGSDLKMKQLIDSIEKMIENVANSADEAAKQEFIANYLAFSSKFHNYSRGNQLLIWAQTLGKATYVASPKRWIQLGREVSDWKNKILIYAPITVTTKTKEDKTDEDGEKKITSVIRFKPIYVYDVSSTKPIPDHPSPFQPVTRKDWSKDSNDDLEEISVLINSLSSYIKEKNIHLNYEELDVELGGYSAGGKIAINDKFKGINLFSTLVHETAHEILHWLETHKGKSEIVKTSTSKQKEIDAEVTAYVVCHHFGFETKDTPNYLALWQAKGEEVKERKENIHKAAKMIIQGIEQKVPELEIEFSENPVEESYSFINFIIRNN